MSGVPGGDRLISDHQYTRPESRNDWMEVRARGTGIATDTDELESCTDNLRCQVNGGILLEGLRAPCDRRIFADLRGQGNPLVSRPPFASNFMSMTQADPRKAFKKRRLRGFSPQAGLLINNTVAGLLTHAHALALTLTHCYERYIYSSS